MKAVVRERLGSPNGLALREIEAPDLPDDRVLLRVRAASVNALDWHSLHVLPNLIGKLLRMPSTNVCGRDVAGVVESTGPKVSGLKPGDEVFGTVLGSFAEYAVGVEERLASKPRNLSFEESSALPIAGCTALQGLRDAGRLRPGRSVAIYGAGGGVGTLAVRIAKALGGTVTAVSRAENLELLRSIGADEVVDYAREDFTRRGRTYDVILDVGADRSPRDLLRALAPDGMVVHAGASPKLWLSLPRMIFDLLVKSRNRATLFAKITRDDLLALRDLAEAGKLAPVVEEVVPLADAPRAIRRIGTRNVRGKLVVKVS